MAALLSGFAAVEVKKKGGRSVLRALCRRGGHSIENYCCPLKVSEQRDIHPQCCCNGIADDFSEGKPLS